MSALKMEKVYYKRSGRMSTRSKARARDETNGAEVVGLVDGDEEVLDLKVLEVEIAWLSMVAVGEAVTRSVGVVCDMRAFYEKQ
jgi:hypothetical protein